MGLRERATDAYERAAEAQVEQANQRRGEARQQHLGRFGDVLKQKWLSSDIATVDILLVSDPENGRPDLLTAGVDGLVLGMYANQNDVHLIRECERCGEAVESRVLTELVDLGSVLTVPPVHTLCPREMDEEGMSLFPLTCPDCGKQINAAGEGAAGQVCNGLGGKHTVPVQPKVEKAPTPGDALAGAIRLLVVQTLNEVGATLG